MLTTNRVKIWNFEGRDEWKHAADQSDVITAIDTVVANTHGAFFSAIHYKSTKALEQL